MYRKYYEQDHQQGEMRINVQAYSKAVQDTVNDVTNMMTESGEMARQQATAMDEINNGIEQISNVVQNNSATAEESSAVSQELSEQSENLNDLISQFSVK